MTGTETRHAIYELLNEESQARKEELEKIIDKLFNYSIAQNDKHYDFLKEIEEDLREFKKNL